jgi:hypothetical protein
MARVAKLELHKETLRSLSDETLRQVAGGDAPITDICGGDTGTFVCPSGATWFWDCQSVQVPCG